MTEREKIAILEDIMEADENSITADMVLKEIDEYDSMSALGIMIMFKNRFGKKISPEQMRAFVTVADVLAEME